ncbi:MAG TPA: dihydropteroate synthase [Candidatus Angelobacter sp.]|jgi:dihydropteroate synthase|nr:dihydropteroate synthase [Candidatus Angelobacter sp.]
MERPSFSWRLRTRTLELGPRTLVMGILNVTPDSFSDGGKFLARDRAVAHALKMLDDGADLLDIGGESTRPGTPVVESGIPAAEELRRIMPVIEDVLRERPGAILSVDTYKAEVARAAVNAGCEIVNDVSALRWDDEMAATVIALACGVVLMHTRGRPQEWRDLPPSADIVAEVKADLRDYAQSALAQGIAKDQIMLDVGIGFGKKFEQNYPLLAGLDQLQDLGFPLLVGTSRKSFIGRTLAVDGKDAPPGQRLHGSLAAMTASLLKGAHVVRVHDVKAAVEAVKIADEVLRFQSRP